jgi:hypothetical protein
MLTTTLDTIRRENAAFARETEYIKEIAKDDILDACMEKAEDLVLGHETIAELEEAAQLVDKLSVEDTDVTEAEEIERILNADGDITFEEMIGL